MVHVPGRKAVSGPALVRLLARLTDADLPESEPSLSDRLGQWLVWTDAIALSSALSSHPSAGGARAPAREPDPGQDALCARVHTSLTDAIARDPLLAPQRLHSRARHRQDLGAPDAAPDYAAFRQRYLALQEKMESAVGNLRTLLRGMLAAGEPAMARLASVDAVMERVLAVREHHALAAVPGLLAAHFERLREAAAATDTQTAQDGPWLDAFRKDMQSVLFAELEIRFQPVEGLRAALRAR